MWIHARHPGWGRLAIALAFGPALAPVPLIFLEDNPAAALLTLLTTPSQDVAQTASAIAYPVTLIIGLPVVLALAKRGSAGFIPVVGTGAVLGVGFAALFGGLGGEFMFLGSLGASSGCWLIAFVKNPRARMPPDADRTGRVLGLTS